MMSADATGSFTTSAHPAALRTGSRRERTATIANAANATTTRIGAHLGRQEIILGFIGLLHESAMSPVNDVCSSWRSQTLRPPRLRCLSESARVTVHNSDFFNTIRRKQSSATPPFLRNRMSNSGDEPALATRNHLGLNKQLRPSLDHDHDHDRRHNDNDSEAACARGMQAPDQERTRFLFRWARGRQR
jgi:hypothetical protein